MSKINQAETKPNGMRQVVNSAVIKKCSAQLVVFIHQGCLWMLKPRSVYFVSRKSMIIWGKKLYTNKHVLLFCPNIFYSYLLDPFSAVHTFVSAVQVYPFINPSAGCRATCDLHMNCVPKGDHFFCLIVIICFVSAYTVLEYFRMRRNK